MTIEAALSLTLFLFAAITLTAPLKIMDQYRKVQASIESVGEEISQYAYISYRMENGDQSLEQGREKWDQELMNVFSETGLKAYTRAKLAGKVEPWVVGSINLSRSKILQDGETIDLIADFKARLPFSVFGLEGVSLTARSRRRAWIGVDGGKDQSGGGGGGGQEEEIVYVGKEGTRYHKNRQCHYLSNNLNSVSASSINDYRNTDGGKYYPCTRCANSGAAAGNVYIMPSGSSYHSSRFCTSIVAYVRAVPLSEVRHLGACSYCGK